MQLRLETVGDEIREKIFYLAISAAERADFRLQRWSRLCGAPRSKLRLPTRNRSREKFTSLEDVVSETGGRSSPTPSSSLWNSKSRSRNQNVAQAEGAFAKRRALVRRARGLFPDRDRRCRDTRTAPSATSGSSTIEKQPEPSPRTFLYPSIVSWEWTSGAVSVAPVRIGGSDRLGPARRTWKRRPLSAARRIGARLFSTTLAGRAETTARQHRGRLEKSLQLTNNRYRSGIALARRRAASGDPIAKTTQAPGHRYRRAARAAGARHRPLDRQSTG